MRTELVASGLDGGNAPSASSATSQPRPIAPSMSAAISFARAASRSTTATRPPPDGEPPRRRGGDPRSAAGGEQHLALEVHGATPSVGSWLVLVAALGPAAGDEQVLPRHPVGGRRGHEDARPRRCRRVCRGGRGGSSPAAPRAGRRRRAPRGRPRWPPGPGDTALTRMPRGASSSASVWVRLIMPALAAAYGPVRGEPRVPAPDEMLTITPPARHAVGGRLGALERRGEVQLELRPPDLVGRVDQLPDRLLVGAADVVDPHVEPTELGHGPLGQLLGEVADVGVGDQRPAAPARRRRRPSPRGRSAAGR